MGSIDPKLLQRYTEIANQTLREQFATPWYDSPFYRMVDDVPPLRPSRVGWKHVNEPYMEEVVRGMAEGIEHWMSEVYWSYAKLCDEPFVLPPGYLLCCNDLTDWAEQMGYPCEEVTASIPEGHVAVFQGMPAAEVTASCVATEEEGGLLMLNFTAGVRPLYPIRLYRINRGQRRYAKRRKQSP